MNYILKIISKYEKELKEFEENRHIYDQEDKWHEIYDEGFIDGKIRAIKDLADKIKKEQAKFEDSLLHDQDPRERI